MRKLSPSSVPHACGVVVKREDPTARANARVCVSERVLAFSAHCAFLHVRTHRPFYHVVMGDDLVRNSMFQRKRFVWRLVLTTDCVWRLMKDG